MVESFHIPMTEGDTLEQGGRIKNVFQCEALPGLQATEADGSNGVDALE